MRSRSPSGAAARPPRRAPPAACGFLAWSHSADCALALADGLRVRALARDRASGAPLDPAMATTLQAATSGVRIGFHKDTQVQILCSWGLFWLLPLARLAKIAKLMALALLK